MAFIGPCERCGCMHTSYGNYTERRGGHYCDVCYNRYYNKEAKARIKRSKKIRIINKKWWQFWI